jgi:large subunit ribosomal protein L21
MVAIIELKGKQYRVETGQVIRSLRLDGAAGDMLTAERVLALIEGESVRIGQPLLDGASVSLEIVRQAKSPKIKVFTYRPRKRISHRHGYRDKITYLRVNESKG